MSSRDRTLSRDIEAVLVPYGNKFTVSAGARVSLMQTLGGSFTVMGEFGMARVGDEYADALGEKAATVPKQQPSESDSQPVAAFSPSASAYSSPTRAMPNSPMTVKLPPRDCMRDTRAPADTVNLLP